MAAIPQHLPKLPVKYRVCKANYTFVNTRADVTSTNISIGSKYEVPLLAPHLLRILYEYSRKQTHIFALAICTNSKVIPIYISEMDFTNGDDFSVIIWKCKQTNWRITNIFSTSFSGNKIEINRIWLARKQCLSETCLNNVGDLVAVILFCCSNSVYESRVYVIALYVIASTYYYKRFELYLFHSTVGLQISERNFKSNQALKMRWAKIHHFAVLYNTNLRQVNSTRMKAIVKVLPAINELIPVHRVLWICHGWFVWRIIGRLEASVGKSRCL